MQWIDVEAELTTAITNLVLAAGAIYAIVRVLKSKSTQSVPRRTTIWAMAFSFLSLAALLGFYAHGFVLSQETEFLIWQPLYLCLGLAMSFFALGVIIDLVEQPPSGPLIGAFIAIGVGFYAMTLYLPRGFVVFIAYEGAILLFALVSYVILHFRRSARYAVAMLAGIGVTIIAAAIQASGAVSFRLIWEFDHNGIFHLVQVVGVLLLARGIADRAAVGAGVAAAETMMSAGRLRAP
jgi:hypothetical protein